MRICRVVIDDALCFGVIDGLDASGEISDQTVIALLDGHPFNDLRPDGRIVAAVDTRLVAPVLPSKVVAVHAGLPGAQAGSVIAFTVKPSTGVIGPNEAICLPWQSERVQARAELAIVVGRLCRDVPVERVPEVVLGYTCAVDVVASDLADLPGMQSSAGAFDSFSSLGPWIVTDLDPEDVSIELRVGDRGSGDETVHHARTSDLLIDVGDVVSSVSAVMTLLPGDVILTGCSVGPASLIAEDRVEVSVSGIGKLRNPVIDRV